jgi:serine/threonine-protein kinase
VGGAGLIKVLDFGISKQMTSEQGSLTQTHTVMGSPLYMAPEQLRSSRQADPRSDVWGLGVVLYELLTCRCPFEAESLPDLCVQITREPPRPIEKLRGDVPEELRGVLARCLEKDPSRRFADAAELAAALRPFLDTPSRRLPEHPRASRPALAETLAAPATTASTRAPRRMTPWITAAIAVAVAATWTGATLARRGEPPAPGLSRAAIDAALTSSLVSRDVPPAVLVSVVTTATEIRPPPAASAPRNTVPPRAAVRVAPASRQEVVQAPAPPADDIPAFR